MQEQLAEESPTETQKKPSQQRASVALPTLSVVKARERAKKIANNPVILETLGLTKKYGNVVAANDINIQVKEGSFTGIVGPNGAGKTTTLTMMSGLNRPSSGKVLVGDVNVWSDGPQAKRIIGSLPDRLRLFSRLTGAQMLYYSGVLHGVKQTEIIQRSKDLSEAFALENALNRRVEEYSIGMQKKIALACALIHAPKVLVLDEPFETIDPVSASNVTQMLEKYVANGGSVILSSHSLELIERVCDHVVVIFEGDVVAQGTVDEVRGGLPLAERFKNLTRESETGKGISWLHQSSDSE